MTLTGRVRIPLPDVRALPSSNPCKFPLKLDNFMQVDPMRPQKEKGTEAQPVKTSLPKSGLHLWRDGSRCQSTPLSHLNLGTIYVLQSDTV